MFILNQLTYPVHAFPPQMCLAAEELAQNVQITDIIAGTSCLTALSIALSPLVDWRHPLSGQVRPCVLYQAIAAISGDRKSSAETVLCAPLYHHDIAAIEQQDQQEKTYKKAKARWTAVHSRALGQYAKLVDAGNTTTAEARLTAIEAQEPTKPTAHRLIYTDVTNRSMFEALEGNGRAMALLTDEGQTLLSSTVMRHYGLLNSIWDGKPLLPLDRAEHKHLIARNPRLTISFMIQPDVLADFFAKRGKLVQASGFCARFLFSRSPTIQGRRPPRPSPPLEHIPSFHGRLRELLAAYKRMLASGRVNRDILEFDEQAKLLWLQIAGKVEADFRPGQFLHDISDFGNKYMDIVGRIACLLHCFEITPSSLLDDRQARTNAIGQISADTLSRAEQIATWHLNEYKQLFSPPLQRTPEELDADSIYSYLYRNFHLRNVGEVLKNHVRQYSGVRNSNRLYSALQILAARQAISVRPVIYGESKKPKDVIALNPHYFNSCPIC
ncbi:YfjI family protein [Xanthomonas campestris]|uniref:YfjI family protein n=1 Tax=Xanthomonas campestris pv. papavericola TaxID=487881 RepID=A0AAJ2X1K3_XANCA|nr:YfjI family protein [Xanthomonas campestris]MEC3887140.1 YfjI family protein [Xanthomonas campestris pv. papavericola]